MGDFSYFKCILNKNLKNPILLILKMVQKFKEINEYSNGSKKKTKTSIPIYLSSKIKIFH